MRTRTLLASSTAILALTLTGCSSGEDKEDPAAEPTPTQTVPAEAESHAVVDVTDDDVSTRERLPTDEDSLITTPSGNVEVESIESTPAVPSALVGAGDTSDGGDGMAVPAEGEAFFVVTLTAAEANGGDETDEDPVVGFEMDGSPVQAPSLRDSGSTTLLISVPEYGQAFLTVEEDGKVQKLNLADGKRDEKTAAAGYYLDDPKTPGAVTLDPVKATGTIGLNSESEKTATMTPSLAMGSLEFAAWTKAKGWADEGEAWLLLNGSADMATAGAGELRGKATFVVEVLADGDKAGEFTVKLDETGGARETQKAFAEPVSVPVDAKKLEMTTSGTVAVSAAGGVELTSEKSASAGSDRREIPAGE